MVHVDLHEDQLSFLISPCLEAVDKIPVEIWWQPSLKYISSLNLPLIYLDLGEDQKWKGGGG